jgi:peptidyl-dipeptidase A
MTAAVEARLLCDQITRDVEPLQEQLNLAYWNLETTGAEHWVAETERLQTALMKRLANRAELARLNALRQADLGDDRLAREVLLWRNQEQANAFDDRIIEELSRRGTELLALFNSFRADLGGRKVDDNQIDDILANTTDSRAAEAAWRASKRVALYRGEAASPLSGSAPLYQRLIELVKLRNEGARSQGFRDYYAMALELAELDEGWLFRLLDQLAEQTAPAFRRMKAALDAELSRRFGVAPDQLRPWHYGDRFFQRPPKAGGVDLDPLFTGKDLVALTRQTYQTMGLDIEPILAKSDLFPGDPATSKKCQHAFCLSIRIPDDVRILCNITDTDRWMSTMLHEFGHGVYDAGIDPALPFALRSVAHTLTTEAVALLMERHRFDAHWLRAVAGVPPAEAERLQAATRRHLAQQHLIFTRWVLVMCHFERALYADPDRPDLNRLWWELVERYQELRRPSPDHDQPDWASKIHLTSSPAYYQNYLLGELFGAQLQAALTRACAGRWVLNPAAGRFLTERLFRPGATHRWDALLERLTGEPLNTRYFLAALDGSG